LYEFPMMELRELPMRQNDAWATVAKQYFSEYTFSEIPQVSLSKIYRQTLTHRYINAVFLTVELPTYFPVNIFKNPVFSAWKCVFLADFKEKFSLPRIISLFLSDNTLTFAF